MTSLHKSINEKNRKNGMKIPLPSFHFIFFHTKCQIPHCFSHRKLPFILHQNGCPLAVSMFEARDDALAAFNEDPTLKVASVGKGVTGKDELIMDVEPKIGGFTPQNGW